MPLFLYFSVFRFFLSLLCPALVLLLLLRAEPDPYGPAGALRRAAAVQGQSRAPASVLSVFVSFILLFYHFLFFLSLTALGSFLRSFFLCSSFVLFSYFFLFVPAVFLSFSRSFALSVFLSSSDSGLQCLMFCSHLSLLGRL